MIYLYCRLRPGQPLYIFVYQHHWPELPGGFYLRQAPELLEGR